MRERDFSFHFLVTCLLLCALAFVACGCDAANDPNPPSGYVASHEQFYKAGAFVYKTFAKDHPDLAQTANDQRTAEGKLIEAGKTGQPVTPATVPPPASLPPMTAPPSPRSQRTPEKLEWKPGPEGPVPATLMPDRQPVKIGYVRERRASGESAG